MKATFVWLGPTGRRLCKGTVYKPSMEGLAYRVIETALDKASLHNPPIVKWDRLVITIRNDDQRSRPHWRPNGI